MRAYGRAHARAKMGEGPRHRDPKGTEKSSLGLVKIAVHTTYICGWATEYFESHSRNSEHDLCLLLSDVHQLNFR